MGKYQTEVHLSESSSSPHSLTHALDTPRSLLQVYESGTLQSRLTSPQYTLPCLLQTCPFP